MKKKIIIGFVIYLSISMIVFYNPVGAVFGDINIADWDEIASGLCEGTSNLLVFNNETDNDDEFKTTNAWCTSSPNGFQVQSSTGAIPDGLGWWNLTDSYDYIYGFGWEGDFTDTLMNDIIMHFYDDNDVEVLRLEFDGSGINYWGVTLGMTLIDNIGAYPGDQYEIYFTHNQTNLLRCYLYNITNDLQTIQDIELYTSNEWDTFSYIRFTEEEHGQSHTIMFDDFVINTQTTGLWNRDNYITQVTCNSLCQDVFIGSTHTYSFNVEGVGDGQLHLTLYNDSGHVVVMKGLEIGTNVVTIYYPYEYGNGTYTWEVEDMYNFFVDPIDDDYYYETCTFEVHNDVYLTNMTDYYGDFFLEWYTDGSNCYYIWMDVPSVVFYVNDSLLDDTAGSYIGEIYCEDTGNIEYSFFITNRSFDHPIIRRLGGMRFEFPANYYLRLWNTTANTSFGWSKNEVVYVSESLEVCGGHWSDIDDWDGVSEPDEQDNQYNIIIGVFMVCAIGVGFLILTHEPITFIAGGALSAFVFSHSSLGTYQLLPVELGYGIIVVLVLSAVILWLAN